MNTRKSDNPALLQALLAAKRVLFIGAHPDDIEFYCAGLIYYMWLTGVDVTLMVATKGGRGLTGGAGERLTIKRTMAQLQSAIYLGRSKVKLYDYPDKSLSQFIEPLASDIKAYIDKTDLEYIFCWDPDYIYNPHPDHQAAADACRMATNGTRARVIYYGTQRPDLSIALTDDSYNTKIKSIRAHSTETPWYYWLILGRRLRRKLEHDGAGIESKYAEVFRIKP